MFLFRLALHWQILIALILGAVVGVTLNATVSERTSTTTLPNQSTLTIHDSTNRIVIELRQPDGQEQRWVVDPSGRTKGAVASLADLKKQDERAYRLFQDHGRSTGRRFADAADSVGALFLRMLKMVSIPLIIASLTTGVLGLSNASRLGRMFGMTISYYIGTSLLAIFAGLFFVNMIRPGARADGPVVVGADERVAGSFGETLYQQVEALIPANPIAAAANGDFLSIIAFSLAFGIFTLLVGGRTLELFRELFQALFAVMMKMTLAIIYLAPIGVFCLMLYAAATQGVEVFQSLGWYMFTVVCGLSFHSFVTLPLIVLFIARRSPWHFFKAMSPALLTAFSSASSNATLPLTLSCAEERAGISNRVGSFVLPLGATINMDGTALYEVVAVLFIAQLEPAIHFTLAEQIIVVVTALLASIGAAGIPHAGLVMMVIILSAVGLPAEKVGLILAVDRLLDMYRTAVNVWSDSCGTAVISRYEGGEDAEITPEMKQLDAIPADGRG
ncbi:MAG: dicarboxylate/amino acid:cation symporter [Gemmataceae bacterium]